MKKHNLKILPSYFFDVKIGAKKFEVRLNDREYKVGDTLILKEWLKGCREYTGRRISCRVNYILDCSDYFVTGYVVLGIEDVKEVTNE